MKTATARFVALALLVLALAASCDRTPTAPTTPPAPPQPPAEPVITRIELIAPRTLAPGATAQLRVLGHRSDGTTQDITATANFRSEPSDVLRISGSGLATALKLGESFATTQSSPYSSTREVVVVPDATFRMVGQVSEEDNVPVGGARVEVDGVAPVLTDTFGGYRLYGVSGHTRMRVSKSGYITKELTLAISDHHTESVSIAIAERRLDATGTYQLIIEASPECYGQIPESLRTRRYTAEITQNGARIEGRVSGATFKNNVFRGWVTPTAVFLEVIYDAYYFGGADLAEIVDEQTYLVFSGLAPLVPSGRGFSDGFWGSILIFDREPGARLTPQVWCYGAHRMSLVR